MWWYFIGIMDVTKKVHFAWNCPKRTKLYIREVRFFLLLTFPGETPHKVFCVVESQTAPHVVCFQFMEPGHCKKDDFLLVCLFFAVP